VLVTAAGPAMSNLVRRTCRAYVPNAVSIVAGVSATFCSRSFHPIRCDFVAAFPGRTALATTPVCPKSTYLSTHGLFARKSSRRSLSRQGYRQAIGQESRIASGETSRPPISILPARMISVYHLHDGQTQLDYRSLLPKYVGVYRMPRFPPLIVWRSTSA